MYVGEGETERDRERKREKIRKKESGSAVQIKPELPYCATRS